MSNKLTAMPVAAIQSAKIAVDTAADNSTTP
jgi:hypothetical protein